MGKYLWCEDSGSGYLFWCAVCNALFPEIKVETKKTNTGLRKPAGKITSDGNTYYILMDSATDNPDVLRENLQLNKVVKGKANVRIIKLHSFEFALLSFDLLEQWIFAEKDHLRDKRQKYLDARALLIKIQLTLGEGTDLEKLKNLTGQSDNKNTEQIAAKILFEITRNTGFETSKGKLGRCFVNNCCEWDERQKDDICGLDDNRISANKKAELLVNRSILKDAFDRAGL